MRNGNLRLITQPTPLLNKTDPDRSRLKILVEDNDGRFAVYCQTHIPVGWQSNATTKANWKAAFKDLSTGMIDVADKRRHTEEYTMGRPMTIKQGDLES